MELSCVTYIFVELPYPYNDKFVFMLDYELSISLLESSSIMFEIFSILEINVNKRNCHFI